MSLKFSQHMAKLLVLARVELHLFKQAEANDQVFASLSASATSLASCQMTNTV